MRQARKTRVKSKGIQKLGHVKLKRSEAGAHYVFKQFGQSMDIRISKTKIPTMEQFPYVKFSDWLHFLLENDQLEHLVGVKDVKEMKYILGLFWEKFRACHPNHVIFSRGDGVPLNMVIPVLYHGDEGRGLKKRQVMVLSTHGMLGLGSKHTSKKSEDPLKLNYIGNTWTNHYIQCCMPIALYGEQPEALFHMLDLQAKEFSKLFWEGLLYGNSKFYICCIAIKGDSPFISKAGQFNRAFTRRPTRASSKTPCQGVCHLCMAGCEDFAYPVPFEQYGDEFPAWLDTMGLVKPYTTASPLLQIPFHRGGTTEALFQFDLFHNWHQGVGKNFASSAIAVCLELIDETIPRAFEEITEDFKSYCLKKKESPYHKKITVSLLGLEAGFKSCPDASWSKGDFTRLISQWFDDFCKRRVVGKLVDPLYTKCVTCLNSLYSIHIFNMHVLCNCFDSCFRCF